IFPGATCADPTCDHGCDELYGTCAFSYCDHSTYKCVPYRNLGEGCSSGECDPLEGDCLFDTATGGYSCGPLNGTWPCSSDYECGRGTCNDAGFCVARGDPGDP